MPTQADLDRMEFDESPDDDLASKDVDLQFTDPLKLAELASAAASQKPITDVNPDWIYTGGESDPMPIASIHLAEIRQVIDENNELRRRCQSAESRNADLTQRLENMSNAFNELRRQWKAIEVTL